MPCHLSGNGLRASARRTHEPTLTDNSPRRVLMTSPVTPTQSPRCRPVNPSKSGVVASAANNWIRPVESCRTPKASLPWSRRSMSRPAIVTSTPVSAPSSSPPYSSCRAAAVVVGSKRYGVVSSSGPLILLSAPG